MDCISTECTSGCMCPQGLVSDGKGGCVKEDLCPCMHNGASYQPGDKIRVDCNTCTCKDRRWQCTSNQCQGTCAIYGDGHYITFDGKRFSFSGDCEYTLIQDYCSQNNENGTFRVITENIPCGTTGTTCSKAIKLFLGNNELKLSEGNYQVIQRDTGVEVPYQIRYMGIYLVIEANNGLILMWDKKTSMFIKLNPKFQGLVCGLCGNYDGNENNDFTTRSQAVVVDTLEFGNSWKVSPSCPDAVVTKDPCSSNPYRKSWAQRQCSIIQSTVFTACHSQVDPTPYYDACVTDSCACDTGGDCECFCTAVAAYAEACNEAGVCVAWRSPEICPLFCDFYNPPGECEWHYKPCGSPCMKTCRNPSGKCSSQIPALEGCYPKCPPEQPYFDEDSMTCVQRESCGCFDVQCSYNVHACSCTYQGNKYPYGTTIYNTTDGLGSCITAVCGENGTIHRDMYHCTTPATTTTTPEPTTTIFNFTTPSPKTTSRTTECGCHYNGKLFPRGSLLYNTTDGDDWCFTAFCNETCEIEKHSKHCHTTVSPPTTSAQTSTAVGPTTPGKTTTVKSTPTKTESSTAETSATAPTTSLPTTTPYKNCDHLTPPRKHGESWHFGNCTIATCQGGSNITLEPVPCEPVTKPQCANGLPPLAKYDESGCCVRYECQCVCYGWGDPHYVTFDGQYYGFQGNCTYVLVKQIIPKYDNFTVIIDNYNCHSEDGLSCPRSLTIYYKSYEVILDQRTINGITTNLIYVNQKRIIPAYKNSVFTITSSGIDMVLEIPEINALVSFKGLTFSIFLPYSLFHHNTEGQCGTCDNTRKNDCRLPNGQIDPSCPDMANHWRIHDKNKPYCDTTTTVQPPVTPLPPRTTETPICNPVICEIIYGKVFEECRTVIPALPFYEACRFDVCHMPHTKIGCSSLQAYAALCASVGVCVDWRSATGGECDYNCSATKVYKPCGPAVQPTCNARYNEKFIQQNSREQTSDFTEGCFCPQGTILFNSFSDICVPSCGVSVPKDTCELCQCSYEVDPNTRLNIIACDPMRCDKNCQLGFTYQAVPGQCCGQCVQDSCVIMLPDHTVHVIEPGDTWSPAGDKCVKYECVKIEDQFVPVEAKTTCPLFNRKDCTPGTERIAPDGCCHVCVPIPRNCNIKTNTTYITNNGCQSSKPVDITSCGGSCGTYSMYSVEANTMDHTCSCCQEMDTTQKQVQMVCPDGTTFSHSYTYVEKCGCKEIECEDRDTQQSTSKGQEPSKSSKGRKVYRRRR
ncbi:MUC5B protein, partial [Atractosteus spatula]|nr:MUC5B protein [Atractosteus spatula]